MTSKALLAATALAAITLSLPATAAELTVGFSQIGSESGWRAAETTVTKSEAEKRRSRSSSPMRSRSRKTRSRRSAPSSPRASMPSSSPRSSRPAGMTVLKEAKDAKIPVVLLDRDDRSAQGPLSDGRHLRHRPRRRGRRRVAGRRPSAARVQRRRAAGHRRLEPGHQPQEGLRGGDRRQRQHQDRPQPDRRLHPHQGQGSHGKLPQGRRRRQEHLRRLRP